ncbi:MAG: plasmid pRiA4b ORF-3 family protein [Planctomycetes bacterium]|nr:plasmid pRiA4b ORF-3 family protein [Planctomycetota bacterium]
MVEEPTVGRTRRKGRADVVFELKVTLKNIRPPIWRRFVVPPDIRLSDLHHVLQCVIGWYDGHLHQFVAKSETRYGRCDEDWDVDLDVLDERRYRLADLVVGKGDRFVYEYDFGDGWEHLVELVKIMPMVEGVSYPICLKGRRRCPPEDCGGPWGYMNLLSVLDDPKHPEHAELVDWAGDAIDPEAFDIGGVNDLLSEIQLV